MLLFQMPNEQFGSLDPVVAMLDRTCLSRGMLFYHMSVQLGFTTECFVATLDVTLSPTTAGVVLGSTGT